MNGIIQLMDEAVTSGLGFTIPYNPFDMELLAPFFSDMIGKVTLGATVGLGGFMIISGFYALWGFVKGLFK